MVELVFVCILGMYTVFLKHREGETMRLAYTTYGMGHARLVIYRNEKENTSFIARFVDVMTRKESTASFTAFSTSPHGSEAITFMIELPRKGWS